MAARDKQDEVLMDAEHGAGESVGALAFKRHPAGAG
jgi:hypothetical protein